MSTFVGTEYDTRSKRLISIIQALRDCGTEEVIKLPKIAVIGNQSAGKSSLIEAISQVRLPRASGTCTRCPMEVVLRRGDAENPNWSCKVSLRFEHEEGLLKPRFGSFEFAKTVVKEDVSLLLRRAQLAILNPADEPSKYQDLTEDQCKEISKNIIKFSKNTVVLEITGAEVDVTFLDLPGIIASTEKGILIIDEQAHFIDLIRDLATSYVSQSECFILVAISMKDDIDNQAALIIARKHDPHGLRTIGVLTKPDTVDEADSEIWVNIMKSKSHALHYGYYMTRLPKSDEMTLTPEEARKKEINYLTGNAIWGKLPKGRLGSSKLAIALSHRLSDMIQEILPNLKAKLLSEVQTIREDLQKLPKSFEENPQAELWSLCQSFTKGVSEYADGKSDNAEAACFLQESDPHYMAFKEDILRTRPKFLVLAPKDMVVPVCGSGPEEREISLEEVQSMIRKMKKRELPGITPFRVHEYFIRFFVKDWEMLSMNLFRKVEAILENSVQKICIQIFERFRSSGLLSDVTNVFNKILRNAAERTRKEIKGYCWTEMNRPFTLASEYFTRKEEQRTALAISRHGSHSTLGLDSRPLHLKGNPHFQLYDTLAGTARTYPTSEENLCTVLAAYGIKLSSLKQLARIHLDDYDAELDVIAHVMAYFDMASKRIIDDIPMLFETSFALTFAKDLEKNLHDKLDLVGSKGLDNCARYVRDEPEIQKKRKDWTRQLEILKKAEETIIKFHMS